MVNTVQSLMALTSTVFLSGCLCMVPMATMQGERHEGIGKTAQENDVRDGGGMAGESRIK